MHFGEINMFNKNRILTTAICAAAVLGSTYNTSALAVTASGVASAIVTAPLTLVPNTAMDFGKFTPGTGGSVTVDPTGAAVAGGAVTLTGGTPAAATFDITGEAALTYTVSYGAGLLTDGGVNNMAVTPNADNSTGTTSGALQTFGVGAILTVGSGQVAGTYSTANVGGSAFTVTVNYN